MHSATIDTARALDVLARRLARQVERRAVRFGAVPASGDTLAELESIHRAHLARAWVVSGIIPVDLSQLFEDRNYLRGHGALAWKRAINRAGREAQAELDRTRAAHKRQVSFDMSADQRGIAETVERGIQAEIWQAVRVAGLPVVRRISRADVERARAALAAYWKRGGSRKWRASLASDRCTLAALVRIARGAGVGLLGDSGRDFNGSAIRKAIERLSKRIGHGRALVARSTCPVAIEGRL
jgi:hypothetical protein